MDKTNPPPPPTCIDSHAHLTASGVYEEIDQILERAQQAGVERIVNICTDRETLERGLLLKKKYPWILNTGSTTPHDVEKEGEELFPLFETHAKQGDFAAIGETGLDYYYTHSDREIQKQFFKRYLKLALETHLPVVIHCRQAFADLFTLLDTHYTRNGVLAPGVLHCFTGTREEAQEVVARGWYLSLSGIVTFKKSEELKQVAKDVPLDQLLIETDTPYLAPQTKRGTRNEPAFVVETAQVIADIKEIPLETLLAATKQNTLNLFKHKE